MGFRDRDRGDRRGGRGGFGGGGRDFGGGGGGGFQQREAPVKSGDEYDVEITDIAAKGDGICKIQGFIIFVPGTSKGERCRIKISEVRNRFAIAQKTGEAQAADAGADAPAANDASEDEAGDEQAA